MEPSFLLMGHDRKFCMCNSTEGVLFIYQVVLLCEVCVLRTWLRAFDSVKDIKLMCRHELRWVMRKTNKTNFEIFFPGWKKREAGRANQQTSAKDSGKLPKRDRGWWEHREEPRWVTRKTNKTPTLRFFSLGETEGVITLTNVAGITMA